jgi:hypothetical protein
MRITWVVTITAMFVVTSEVAAQPSRQMPGSRVFLPGSPNTIPGPVNTRTPPTDFYARNGYPKFLGDAVETGAQTGITGNTGTTGGAMGITGNTGNTGGIQGGATGSLGGGGLLGFRGYFRNNNQGFGDSVTNGMTGGGFSGLVPKGFGFGGTSDSADFQFVPLHGGRLGILCVLAMPELARAQPSRQMPGGRVFLPGGPNTIPGPPNSRTRAAANAIGLESTDFYPKNGYPKVLGDAVETGAQTGISGNAGGQGGGNNGVTGVQAAGNGGFQGNTGNQIGQQGGGTILGGVFGLNLPNGGIGFGDQIRGTMGVGMTGGGFSGMVPKGFGFGGTPDWSKTWTNSPLK